MKRAGRATRTQTLPPPPCCRTAGMLPVWGRLLPSLPSLPSPLSLSLSLSLPCPPRRCRRQGIVGGDSSNLRRGCATVAVRLPHTQRHVGVEEGESTVGCRWCYNGHRGLLFAAASLLRWWGVLCCYAHGPDAAGLRSSCVPAAGCLPGCALAHHRVPTDRPLRRLLSRSSQPARWRRPQR